MIEGEFNLDSITLRGEEIPVKVGFLPVTDLRFYPENPRVYSIVSADDGEPPQEDIEKALKRTDHVKQLMHSIEANGGLTDALLVRDGDFVVLEGNCRLAAYRILFRRNAIQWGNVKCKLLPVDISSSDVFALLGEYHIIGRKDWAPYEQAGYLYRRYKHYGVHPDIMAKEMGLSSRKIKYMIQVYEFMIKYNEKDVQRWSYYEEYLKHRATKQARKKYPELDQLVVDKINTGEIPTATDVRDKLTTIAKSPKSLQDFVSGKKNFNRAYESAEARGAGNACQARIKRFRTWLADKERDEDVLEMPPLLRKKCTFELKKISKRCDGLMGKLASKETSN